MTIIPAHILQAVILTKNEEPNIRRVLDKLWWIKKIVVVDSYSTDATQSIVNSYPSTVLFERPFDTHATQWNYGLEQAQSLWILSLDADYVLSDAFASEVAEKIELTEFAAFDAEFKFLVFGKPLRGNNTTPRPVLFQKALCSYFDEGHTQRLRISGKSGKFRNTIDHDDRKSLSRWLANQASYSIKESKMLLNTPTDQLSMTSKIRKTKIFAPVFIFLYCLFIKGLLFNGWRGWYYTLQRTIVEMLFILRLIENDIENI